MSATLWLDTGRGETVELGPTLALYHAFAEMATTAGPHYLAHWPDLFGVIAQVESQEDALPAWWRDVRREAAGFLSLYGEELSSYTKGVLTVLREGVPPPTELGRSDESQR